MSKFLSADELYRLIQRELPEGVYPDGPPAGYFSTADSFAAASGLAKTYSNLQRVYDNYFPQFADERIEDWEVKVFGEMQVGTLADRRERVIQKIRSEPSLSLWEMLLTALSYVTPGTYVQVVEYGCPESPAYGWKLGVSKLGSETVLGGGYDVVGGYGGQDICEKILENNWVLGRSKLGTETILGGTYTNEQVALARFRAYTFEVRIFSEVLTSTAWAQLDATLKAQEPARSQHLIFDGLSLATYNLTVDAGDVDAFSLVDCAKVDNTSTTGYKGLERAA
jgi:hypothetical protein